MSIKEILHASRQLAVYLRAALAQQLPYSSSLVGSVSGGFSFQEPLMFLDILPYEVRDIMNKPFMDTCDGCSTDDDSVGYKSVHDAVIELQYVGSRILCHVESENLLFVFCKTFKAVDDFLSRPLHFPSLLVVGEEEIFPPNSSRHDEGRGGDQKDSTKPHAIILCKFRKPEDFEEAISCKKDNPGCDCDYCEITWGEFKELERRCCNRVYHFEENNKNTK